ncbi:MAG: monofunctional biosynthetic peptidoglycan transglycosylase [Gemmatales bacterium]|nr:monofunctional biosynthetic peptidoglycan transglycosylase [Gemmatales bacterium]MDW8224303.1 monofunctional biosynthetic peptidoglycan transglycosylase [Gemmatales bacterium]
MAFILVLILLPPIEVGCAAISTPRTMSLMLRKVVLKKSERQRGAWQSVSWTGIENVSPYFLHAALVGEDRKFFYHNGFDWQSIKAAIYESVRRRRPPHGASTITQQCARSLFLWQGRSWIRKGLEAYYTVWMELLLSKRRILELYVNVIELGEGIYGIEAAAQHYYGKAAKDLSREEAAMLAAILPAPKRWNPLQPNELVKQRQQLILSHIGEVRLPWEPPMKTAQPAAQPTPQ